MFPPVSDNLFLTEMYLFIYFLIFFFCAYILYILSIYIAMNGMQAKAERVLFWRKRKKRENIESGESEIERRKNKERKQWVSKINQLIFKKMKIIFS